MNSNDYLIFSDEKLKPLIITFGGISGGISTPLFEFKNFLQKNVDCHLLFIKDTKQCWYHNGARGLGKNINELKNNIINKIKTINYSKILTIGCSMGGYASLLIGKLIKADIILAFSPQTFIDQKNRNKYNDKRWIQQIKKVHSNFNNTYFDLVKINFNNINKVHIIYGKNNMLDKIHSERLNINNKFNTSKFIGNKSKIIIQAYDGGHNIVKKLRNNGLLIKIINNYIID